MNKRSFWDRRQNATYGREREREREDNKLKLHKNKIELEWYSIGFSVAMMIIN